MNEIYVEAQAGENFIYFFNVVNDGSLPLRVLGVVDENPDDAMAPRWTAIGTHFDELQTGAVPDIDAATPFEPVELGPGETLDLYVVGRAGVCAFGPGFDPSGSSSLMIRNEVRMAFSVLGLASNSRISLPFNLNQPVDEVCSERLADEEVR